MNLASVVAIVLANKVVMTTYNFHFPVCLAFFHSTVTAIGMQAMAYVGLIQVKQLSWRRIAPIAAAYVGFVIFNNLSVQVNTVGFYQLSKIAITPVVVLVEYLAYQKAVSQQRVLAITVLMVGVTVATVTDTQVASKPMGIIVAVLSIASSVLYSVWAGVKQKELDVNGNQLLHQVAPVAAIMLAVLVPVVEPLGGLQQSSLTTDTILGYDFSGPAIAWLLLSSVLGLFVTLSTYLFIGVTSATTYSVVGHLKTICIVASGVIFFQDVLSAKKLLGLCCTLLGIAWYSAA
eukprot:gene2751-3046_t